jgi:hypothetical protein
MHALGFTEQALAAYSHLLLFRLDAAHGSCRASRPGHADSTRSSGRGRDAVSLPHPNATNSKQQKGTIKSLFGFVSRCCVEKSAPRLPSQLSRSSQGDSPASRYTRTPSSLSAVCCVRMLLERLASPLLDPFTRRGLAHVSVCVC